MTTIRKYLIRLGLFVVTVLSLVLVIIGSRRQAAQLVISKDQFRRKLDELKKTPADKLQNELTKPL